MSRKPKVGDFIYFEVEKQANGKVRAINCRIEGVAAKSIKRNTPRLHKNASAPKSKIVIILLVIAIGAFAYQRLSIAPPSKPVQQPLSSPSTSVPVSSLTSENSQFACDGRQHCGQMTSRAEAEYFIKYCPDTKMDGDNDGIPCENDSRF